LKFRTVLIYFSIKCVKTINIKFILEHTEDFGCSLLALAFISLSNGTLAADNFDEDENKCDSDSYKQHTMKNVSYES
jgi:hypothetical protein